MMMMMVVVASAIYCAKDDVIKLATLVPLLEKRCFTTFCFLYFIHPLFEKKNNNKEKTPVSVVSTLIFKFIIAVFGTFITFQRLT